MADEVDRANDLFEDRRNVEIKAISRMLEQHNESDYCDECGNLIEPARKKAMPSAIRCVTCQEFHERSIRLHRN